MIESNVLLTRLEQAINAGDREQVIKALDPAGTPFHRLTTGYAAFWDRYFALVIPLLSSSDPDISRHAEHLLKLGFWFEKPDSASALSRRLVGVLEAVRPRFQVDPELLLRITDDLIFYPEICPDYVALLDELERDTGPTRLPRGVVAAARIAYVQARTPWDEAREVLLSSLDRPEVLVRAYAARGLGTRYQDSEPGSLSPTLADIIGTITDKELARPGIAGPLLSPYYAAMDLARFERDSGLDCKAWLLRILRERQGPEPDLLPCSNGVDFFCHELFEGTDDPVILRAIADYL